jgi:hypothetical protein
MAGLVRMAASLVQKSFVETVKINLQRRFEKKRYYAIDCKNNSFLEADQ